MSGGYRRGGVRAGYGGGGGGGGLGQRTKSHSHFNQPETIEEGPHQQLGRYNKDFNSNLEDEEGITFVARTASQRDPQKDRKVLTEAEAVLPWKRGDENLAEDGSVGQVGSSMWSSEIPNDNSKPQIELLITIGTCYSNGLVLARYKLLSIH